MADIEVVNPPQWDPPVGYANGMVVRGGRLLFLGGQVAFDEHAQTVGAGDLVAQFERTVENIACVLETAGGTLRNVVKLTIFVQDRDDYRRRSREIGQVYRRHFGKHYPAMTLVEVARFYETDVLVEIEGIAVLPD